MMPAIYWVVPSQTMIRIISIATCPILRCIPSNIGRTIKTRNPNRIPMVMISLD